MPPSFTHFPEKLIGKSNYWEESKISRKEPDPNE
jgi:hypothetical protein